MRTRLLHWKLNNKMILIINEILKTAFNSQSLSRTFDLQRNKNPGVYYRSFVTVWRHETVPVSMSFAVCCLMVHSRPTIVDTQWMRVHFETGTTIRAEQANSESHLSQQTPNNRIVNSCHKNTEEVWLGVTKIRHRFKSWRWSPVIFSSCIVQVRSIKQNQSRLTFCSVSSA